MKLAFSFNWLKKHLNTNKNLQQIIEILDNIGLEVEGIIDNSELYSDFIIVEVTAVTAHPNANQLNVCTINKGDETLEIVCGASNVYEGMKTVLAPIGSLIPSNGLRIKKTLIRGVESNGMLCSAEELSLPKGLLKLKENDDGIIELPLDAPVGERFAIYSNLNDALLEINLTYNRRQDCASVFGIARDLAAANAGELYLNDVITDNFNSESSVQDGFKAVINDLENCNELYLCSINNIDISNSIESTAYLEIQNLLSTIGQQHDNPLVNISNFAMFNYGRPNHIYDAEKIKGSIVVRHSAENEHFIALGGKEHSLPAGITVIADSEKVLSIAGIIGGELSKVDISTKNIIVEVANFNPSAIALASRKLNINTESKLRFEGRIDSGNSEFFIKHLSQLILKCCKGKIANLTKISGSPLTSVTELTFDFNLFDKFAAYDISQEAAIAILNKLGFKIKILEDNSKWHIQIPTWRQGDITNSSDIIEEVIRINGLDKVRQIDLSANFEMKLRKDLSLTTKISNVLLSRGMDEVITWSFISEKQEQAFYLNDSISLSNPITNEFKLMRQSIVPNLFEVLQKNYVRGYQDISIFEAGQIYSWNRINNPVNCIAGLRSGLNIRNNIHKDLRQNDFYDIRDDVLFVLNGLGLNCDVMNFSREVPDYYHPGRSAALFLGNKLLAYCGEIHPEIKKNAKFNALNVCVFEIFSDNIPQVKMKFNKPELQLSQFQAVSRDIAFVMPKDILAFEVIKVIRNLKNELIRVIEVFDSYSGSNLPENEQSLGIRLVIQPNDKTLTDKEIEEVVNEVISLVEFKFTAKLRLT